MYKHSKEEIALRFRATGTDNKNWFSQTNLRESPWIDILTAKKNFFTIHGPCWPTGGCRDFHINHFYGGCPKDAGWLSVGDFDGCSWEKRFAHGVKPIYSKAATLVNYNHHGKFKYSTASIIDF